MQTFKYLTLVFLIFSSCSHAPKNSKLSNTWTPLSKSQRAKLVNTVSRSDKAYEGLYIIYAVNAAFLNSEVQTDNLKIRSQFSNWGPQEAQGKLNKIQEELAKESKFFVALYTPRSNPVKLHLKSSDWKVVLKTRLHNLEGKVQLNENDKSHARVFFPKTDMWSRIYTVTFPIPTAELEQDNFELQFISPKAMSTFKY